jgi:hypothetical protein
MQMLLQRVCLCSAFAHKQSNQLLSKDAPHGTGIRNERFGTLRLQTGGRKVNSRLPSVIRSTAQLAARGQHRKQYTNRQRKPPADFFIVFHFYGIFLSFFLSDLGSQGLCQGTRRRYRGPTETFRQASGGSFSVGVLKNAPPRGYGR